METIKAPRKWGHHIKNSQVLYDGKDFTWIGKEANETMCRLKKMQRVAFGDDSHLLDWNILTLTYLNKTPLWKERF